MAKSTSLTEGSVTGVLISFSLPLLLSSAVQQLYNMADSAIVGNFDSSGGLAAIGAAYPICLFIVGICTGAGMGCTVIMSQLFGAGKMKELKSSIYTAIISLGILGIVCAAIVFFMSGLFMRWLGCNEEIFDGARTYLSIYAIGAFPMLVYNAISAAFTGMGDSRKPLYFLIASSVMNIILDIIAVAVMKLGVAGAAWATVISQFFVAAAAILIMIRHIKDFDSGAEKAAVFDVQLFKEMAKISIPCIFQQIAVSLGHILIQARVNTFSTATVAGYEVGGKLINFIYVCFNSMVMGLVSFTGQNYGAGKIDRIRQGLKVTAIINLIFSALIMIFMGLIFPEQISGLFIDGSDANAAEVVRVAAAYLRIVTPDQIAVSFILSLGGLMRGLGDIKVFFIATVADLGTRVVMAYVLTSLTGSYTGLYWAWYFGMAVDMVICVIWYIKTRRTGKLKDA